MHHARKYTIVVRRGGRGVSHRVMLLKQAGRVDNVPPPLTHSNNNIIYVKKKKKLITTKDRKKKSNKIGR